MNRQLRPLKDPKYLNTRPAVADLRLMTRLFKPSGDLPAAQTFSLQLSHERDYPLAHAHLAQALHPQRAIRTADAHRRSRQQRLWTPYPTSFDLG